MKRILVATLVGLLGSGCAVVKVQPEGRVASDQLLISMAVEDAVRQLDLREVVEGRDVRLSVAAFMGTVEQDLSYVHRALEARVLQEGGRVVPDSRTTARELVAMVQSVGSDSDASSVALPVPLPALGSVAVSELTFYTDKKQIARCRLWLYAKDPSGDLAWTHQPVHVAHWIRNPTLLGVTLGKASDIKELDHGKGTIPISNLGLAGAANQQSTTKR